MSRYYDIIDTILFMSLVVINLVAFIRLIIIGEVYIGTSGLVAFILFALSLYRRGNE